MQEEKKKRQKKEKKVVDTASQFQRCATLPLQSEAARKSRHACCEWCARMPTLGSWVVAAANLGHELRLREGVFLE
jgi:hypothetical protein